MIVMDVFIRMGFVRVTSASSTLNGLRAFAKIFEQVVALDLDRDPDIPKENLTTDLVRIGAEQREG
jgi:hypothetical protein